MEYLMELNIYGTVKVKEIFVKFMKNIYNILQYLQNRFFKNFLKKT